MSNVPKRFTKFLEKYPQVGESYKSLGNAVATAGPLDAKVRALVKLGISIGAKQEGAVHSHTRKALEAGASRDEIRHVVLQATTTIGFPNMMAGMSWVDDVLNDDED